MTYTVEAPPTATISTPMSAEYSQNNVVAAAYSCAVAPTTTLTSCTGTVPVGAPINTSTLGNQSFKVTATDATGNSATTTFTYEVIAAPTVQLITPANGAVYTQNMGVVANYGCSSQAAVSCTGTVQDGEGVDTSTPGTHSFTVTASDTAGGTTTQTVFYTVSAPASSGTGSSGSGSSGGGSSGTGSSGTGTSGTGSTGTGTSGTGSTGTGTSGTGSTGTGTSGAPAASVEHIKLVTRTARLTSADRFALRLTTSPPARGTITLSYTHTVTVRDGRHRIRRRVTTSFKASFAVPRNGTSTLTLTLPRALRADFHGLTLHVKATAGGKTATGSLRLEPPVVKRRR